MVTSDQITNMVEDRREQAEQLRFFDANIWLGDPAGFPNARGLSVENLGQTLRKRHLTGGLVSHWKGFTQAAQVGNQALRDVAFSSEAPLYTVWTGLPRFPKEAGPIPGQVLLPPSVRGVRIFPSAHHFTLDVWCIGSLCEWLLDREIPLFIWHTETNCSAIYHIADVYPELTLIVETQTQKILYHTRTLFAMMRQCPNVRVELSNFAGQGFLDYAVREFGAERLIFGSFLPVNDPLVPMGMVLDADISEEEKFLIAGENMRRIIAGVQS